MKYKKFFNLGPKNFDVLKYKNFVRGGFFYFLSLGLKELQVVPYYTTKNKCICIHEIICLNIMKMKMKMKNRSHKLDINRPRFEHADKYGKYKKYLIMTVLIWFKQHLSNI